MFGRVLEYANITQRYSSRPAWNVHGGREGHVLEKLPAARGTAGSFVCKESLWVEDQKTGPGPNPARPTSRSLRKRALVGHCTGIPVYSEPYSGFHINEEQSHLTQSRQWYRLPAAAMGVHV